MPLSINGSGSTLPVSTNNSISQGFERVSSGKRINSAIDDAAGLAIASRFSREINALGVASRNAGDGISLVQVADGALNSVSSNLQRIRDLAVQSANGALNDQDRAGLAAEARQLGEENQSILERTSFNGVPLLNQSDSFEFQIGPNAGDQISIQSSNLSEEFANLGLGELDLSTQQGATNAISVLDDASKLITDQAAELGGVANRLEQTIDSIGVSSINQAESRSRIEDADLAKELADISAGLVKEQVGISVQTQANAQQAFVLRLLQ